MPIDEIRNSGARSLTLAARLTLRQKSSRSTDAVVALKVDVNTKRQMLLLLFIAFVFTFSASSAQERFSTAELVLLGGTVYPSPVDEPLAGAVVVIRGRKIEAVKKKGEIKLPKHARVLDCRDMVITAGFWNSHVHFLEKKWEGAERMPARQLAAQLREMLTRYGFTTVFDTGSRYQVTDAIRTRIESGEVDGPRILTTGEIIYPKGGRPRAELLSQLGYIGAPMPEVSSPDEGRAVARELLDRGVDALKIYAVPFYNPSIRMSPETIKAIVDEAHQRGKKVFAHPTNIAGLENCLEGGVDVVVHTTPQDEIWSRTLVDRMLAARMALIPTLKLWRFELLRDKRPLRIAEAFQLRGIEQLEAFVRTSGEILFGTDVGYMTDYDPTEEYVAMSRASMSHEQILASLTTTPARRFDSSNQFGEVKQGMEADLVVLEGSSLSEPTDFASVRYTLRAGRVIYRRPPR